MGAIGVLAAVLTACGGSDPVATVPVTSSTLATPTTTVPPSTTTTTTTTAPPTTTTTLPPARPARYRLTVDNMWSEATHPDAVPGDAHFSWLAGATHNAAVSFWTVGEPASPGVTEMAETGRTDLLVSEIEAADGVAATLDWPWWFCAESTTSSKCGELAVEFDVDPDYPFLTLAAMIGPSPDWFVGVDSLALMEGGQWRPEIEVALFPYDGGTRTSNRFKLFGPQNDPPEPIAPVTAESGKLIGPQQIGSYTLTLVSH